MWARSAPPEGDGLENTEAVLDKWAWQLKLQKDSGETSKIVRVGIVRAFMPESTQEFVFQPGE